MQREVLNVDQLVNGIQAEIWISIDGGSLTRAKEVKEFNFDTSVNIENERVMGSMATQPRITGLENTGNIVFREGSTIIDDYILKIQNNEKPSKIDVTTINNDPQSTRGTKSVRFENVTFNSNVWSQGNSDGSINEVSVDINYSKTIVLENYS